MDGARPDDSEDLEQQGEEDEVDKAALFTTSSDIPGEIVVLRNKQNGDGNIVEPPLRDSIPTKSLGSPSKTRPTSVYASRNSRRRMEDRHVILHDLKAYLPSSLQNKIEPVEHVSFYAVYDGHAGNDAAAFAAATLHEKLVESDHYPADPVQAFLDAMDTADKLFAEKSRRSGATAVCNLIKGNTLYSAWLGDSQTVLVRNGQSLKIVEPHKPNREDEMERITALGGQVIFWGTWRVNGSLAVSRALGDAEFKPYVSAVPDVTTVQLTDSDEFLIVGCDGLWDGLTPDAATQIVYDFIFNEENKWDLDSLSSQLCQKSVSNGSTDNISVIVVFLQKPEDIVKKGRREERTNLENLRVGLNSTCPFVQEARSTSSQRDSLDPQQHLPTWATEQPVTPTAPLPAYTGFDQSGGEMFSPDPFAGLSNGKSSFGDKEMFKSLTAEDLIASPLVSPLVSSDSVDLGVSRVDSPHKGDSGFNSPKKGSDIEEEEGGEGEEVEEILTQAAIDRVDDLFRIINNTEDSPSPDNEEKTLEEILAERRQMPEDSIPQSFDEDDDDDDDDDYEGEAGGEQQQQLVVDDEEDDDNEEEGDFARVDCRTKEEEGMDPCEQVVVKETHPEESGCLVPPVSQLPSCQEAVKELIPEVEALAVHDEPAAAAALEAAPATHSHVTNGVAEEAVQEMEVAEPETVPAESRGGPEPEELDTLLDTAMPAVSQAGDATTAVAATAAVEESAISFEEQDAQSFVLKTPALAPTAEANSNGLQIPSLNVIPSTPVRSRSPVQSSDNVENHVTSDVTTASEPTQPLPADESAATAVASPTVASPAKKLAKQAAKSSAASGVGKPAATTSSKSSSAVNSKPAADTKPAATASTKPNVGKATGGAGKSAAPEDKKTAKSTAASAGARPASGPAAGRSKANPAVNQSMVAGGEMPAARRVKSGGTGTTAVASIPRSAPTTTVARSRLTGTKENNKDAESGGAAKAATTTAKRAAPASSRLNNTVAGSIPASAAAKPRPASSRPISAAGGSISRPSSARLANGPTSATAVAKSTAGEGSAAVGDGGEEADGDKGTKPKRPAAAVPRTSSARAPTTAATTTSVPKPRSAGVPPISAVAAKKATAVTSDSARAPAGAEAIAGRSSSRPAPPSNAARAGSTYRIPSAAPAANGSSAAAGITGSRIGFGTKAAAPSAAASRVAAARAAAKAANAPRTTLAATKSAARGTTGQVTSITGAEKSDDSPDVAATAYAAPVGEAAPVVEAAAATSSIESRVEEGGESQSTGSADDSAVAAT